MAIILPQDHPANSRLKSQGIAVRETETGSPAINLGFVNLMPMVYLDETLDLLLARLSHSSVDVRPVFINPEDARKGVDWDTAKQENLDAVLVTGYAASNMKFEDLTFWSGLQDILDDTARLRLPLFGVCAGAMAIAHHLYGVSKEQAAHKLLGNYEYTTKDGDSLLLATSRHNTLNRRELLQAVKQGKLDIVAQTTQTPQPEPAILADRARNVILTLAHLEYSNTKSIYPGFEGQPLDILTYQYQRDHKPGPKFDATLAARVKPPVNPSLTAEQVQTRETYAENLLSSWVEQAAALKQDRRPVASREYRAFAL